MQNNKVKATAVIPARGGSKRIPRKNIRQFAGRPMIAYSIECAIKSKLFDRILVSTDDAEIAEIAKTYGAEVPFMRPAALSDDYTPVNAVIAHALDWLLVRGIRPSAVCAIYATAVFMRVEDLCQGLKILAAGNWEYVFSATDFEYPIFRAFQNHIDTGVKMFFPEYYETRSQDLPLAFHDAGQFYWGRTRAWLDNGRIFDKNSTVVTIPRWRVQDIDTLEDWKRAEMVWKALQTIEKSE